MQFPENKFIMGIFSSKSSKDSGAPGKGDSSNQGQPQQPEKPKTKREMIADKYRQMDERSQAIQDHLKWLESFNRRKHTNSYD